jgi:hypothetical protein
MHSLANDPTLPPGLAAAFARVRYQVVATMSDGAEAIVNCLNERIRDEHIAKYQEIISRDGGNFRDGRKMVSVEVRAL